MYQMMGVFAEFERSMIQEGVRAELARAKSEGKRLGRPPISTDLENSIQCRISRWRLLLQRRRRPRSYSAIRVGPCVDGSELARAFFTSQAWSVQPCVRPMSAVHMTAGHNALRGSGPGQYGAFKNAVARVGCPDRRNDRLCITCCSPSQPSHHAEYSARSRQTLSAAG